VAACGSLGTDLTQVIAISISVADTAFQGDTVRAHAKALTAGGDSVTTAVRWASFDTSIVGVVDSTVGTFIAKRPGTTSIQARAGTLRSNLVPISVIARPTP
jgi:hypothetical protein